MFASGLVGYLLGSFPAAYLLVRWKSKLDIRQEGSGNVGGLNSYIVTKSKPVGVAVLVLDLLKGVLAILIVSAAATGFIYLAAAGIGAVLGHNFPVWLKFRGGRGLATSLGVLLALGCWQIAVAWAVFWALAYLVVRHVNVANAVATALVLIAVLVLPASIERGAMPPDASTIHFSFFIVLLAGLILIKHIDPIQEYFKSKKGSQAGGGESAHAGS